WYKNDSFTKFDNYLRIFTVSVAHTQLLIGLWLYTISPLVRYFLNNFERGIKIDQIRFFGLEHITMMLLAMTFITIGSGKGRRSKNDKENFRAMTIWYFVAWLVIVTSIPWPFSPFTSRPYLRPFYAHLGGQFFFSPHTQIAAYFLSVT